jgi:hypothetical protein
VWAELVDADRVYRPEWCDTESDHEDLCDGLLCGEESEHQTQGQEALQGQHAQEIMSVTAISLSFEQHRRRRGGEVAQRRNGTVPVGGYCGVNCTSHSRVSVVSAFVDRGAFPSALEEGICL